MDGENRRKRKRETDKAIPNTRRDSCKIVTSTSIDNNNHMTVPFSLKGMSS
jgi:hypothetical protein